MRVIFLFRELNKSPLAVDSAFAFKCIQLIAIRGRLMASLRRFKRIIRKNSFIRNGLLVIMLVFISCNVARIIVKRDLTSGVLVIIFLIPFLLIANMGRK